MRASSSEPSTGRRVPKARPKTTNSPAGPLRSVGSPAIAIRCRRSAIPTCSSGPPAATRASSSSISQGMTVETLGRHSQRLQLAGTLTVQVTRQMESTVTTVFLAALNDGQEGLECSRPRSKSPSQAASRRLIAWLSMKCIERARPNSGTRIMPLPHVLQDAQREGARASLPRRAG
jgi:hypothetical protein